MPLIKPEALPLPGDQVEALRARLVAPYDHALIVQDDKRLLFIRAAGDVPDPIADLELGLDSLPGEPPRDVASLYVLGTRGDMHIPGAVVQRLLDDRRRLDDALASHARAQLDSRYGVRVTTHPADTMLASRLLLRVPHARVIQFDEADLVALAERIGPLHLKGGLERVRSCHLVADEDHVRLPPVEALADLLERWSMMEARRRADSEVAAAPRPVEGPAVVAEPAPLAPRKRKVEDVTAVVEFETVIHAQPLPPPSAPDEDEPERAFVRLLGDAGFRVKRSPFLSESPFHLEAERGAGYPRKIALLRYARVGLDEARGALELARLHPVDLLFLLSPETDTDAARRLVTTKVKVIRPDEVGLVRL